MHIRFSSTGHLLYVLVAATAVYIFAHWPALTNPYVINDDVRQQIFWMQQWQDPELYQNDLLTEYARNYVPWGVQAIYKAAAQFINPVQFTKVLTGLLFVITAGFLFGMGLQFRDDLTPIFIAITFCFMGGFMDKISGGLSQSFGFPLLTAYLFFLGRNSLAAAGAVIFIQSLLNPYIFLLCAVTHGMFLAYNIGKIIAPRLRVSPLPAGCSATSDVSGRAMRNGEEAGFFPDILGLLRASSIPPITLFASVLLVAAGCGFILLKYAFYSPSEFGQLVTWTDMVGKIEYTAAGRYEIMPIPPMFYELIRPWIFDLPFTTWGPVPAWILAFFGLGLIFFALTRGKWDLDLSAGFRVFGYLFAASLLLYLAACVFIFKLFVPSRYIEFSVNVFYCVAIGTCIRVAIGKLVSRRIAFPVASSLFAILAALALYRVGIYDYSSDAALYRFVRSTPKTSLMAGPPDLMDNVLTFGHRKAFVTYELSHTWYSGYWQVIKKRTFDFYRAYYAKDPAEVREFCRENGIDYLIVRDEDFSPDLLKKAQIHFEPFDTYIKELVTSRSHYAVLDKQAFPPIYEKDGIRVLRMR